MARVTVFSSWLNNVLDHQPEITGRELKEVWAGSHPWEDFPSHGLSALSQAKKRRQGIRGDRAPGQGASPPESAAQGSGRGTRDPSAALDRLARIVTEYRRIKTENETLKRRLIEIAGQVE